MANHDKVQINYSETDNTGFNNPAHLENFLNYLYRTDKAQKHTNALTTKCMEFAVHNGDVFVKPFGTLDERLERRQKGRQFLGDITEAVSGRKTSPSKFFNTKIIYFEVFGDDDRDITRELDEESLHEAMQMLVTTLHEERNCLYVAHLDQDDAYHIHVVQLAK